MFKYSPKSNPSLRSGFESHWSSNPLWSNPSLQGGFKPHCSSPSPSGPWWYPHYSQHWTSPHQLPPPASPPAPLSLSSGLLLTNSHPLPLHLHLGTSPASPPVSGVEIPLLLVVVRWKSHVSLRSPGPCNVCLNIWILHHIASWDACTKDGLKSHFSWWWWGEARMTQIERGAARTTWERHSAPSLCRRWFSVKPLSNIGLAKSYNSKPTLPNS